MAILLNDASCICSTFADETGGQRERGECEAEEGGGKHGAEKIGQRANRRGIGITQIRRRR